MKNIQFLFVAAGDEPAFETEKYVCVPFTFAAFAGQHALYVEFFCRFSGCPGCSLTVTSDQNRVGASVFFASVRYHQRLVFVAGYNTRIVVS